MSLLVLVLPLANDKMKIIIPIDDLIEYFNLKQLSDRTIKEYGVYYDKFPFDDFTQEGIYKFLRKNNNNVARAFLKNIFEFIRISKYETELKMFVHQFIIPQSKRKKHRELPKILSVDEVYSIADAMTTTRNEVMVLIQFYGALRSQELLDIKPYDFNWDAWIDDGERPGELLIKGKGGKQRKVFLPKELMNHIFTWIRQDISQKQEKDILIFNIGFVRWDYILKSASMKAIGVRIKTHLLRQSFATYLRKKGWGIEDIRDYLGHESITTTTLYALHDPVELRKKINELY